MYRSNLQFGGKFITRTVAILKKANKPWHFLTIYHANSSSSSIIKLWYLIHFSLAKKNIICTILVFYLHTVLCTTLIENPIFSQCSLSLFHRNWEVCVRHSFFISFSQFAHCCHTMHSGFLCFYVSVIYLSQKKVMIRNKLLSLFQTAWERW